MQLNDLNVATSHDDNEEAINLARNQDNWFNKIADSNFILKKNQAGMRNPEKNVETKKREEESSKTNKKVQIEFCKFFILTCAQTWNLKSFNEHLNFHLSNLQPAVNHQFRFRRDDA